MTAASTPSSVRPSGGRPRRRWVGTVGLLIVAALLATVPWLGSRYYTFVATEMVILALFATSLNLLLGYTGAVSFGHAAYFGIGAYTCGILTKTHGISFAVALGAAPVLAGLFAAVVGFFCVRLTRIYFAMLTLAFAQIVWGIALKWNSVTGGEQGLSDVPYPDFAWTAAVPALEALRPGEQFYLVVLVVVTVCLALLRMIVHSPFGRMLTVIRENRDRAQFIGLDVRRYELAAFVIAGAFAGVAGALSGVFNRGVFTDSLYWSESAEVLIMTILGGIGHFWGPAVGAAAMVWMNQEIVSYTQYWPFVLGVTLVILLFAFPGGIVGALDAGWRRLRAGTAR
jgi:branched-chain amino acid transport system permease protein